MCQTLALMSTLVEPSQEAKLLLVAQHPSSSDRQTDSQKVPRLAYNWYVVSSRHVTYAIIIHQHLRPLHRISECLPFLLQAHS